MHRALATQIVKVNNAAFPPRGRSPTTAQLHSKVDHEINKISRAFLSDFFLLLPLLHSFPKFVLNPLSTLSNRAVTAPEENYVLCENDLFRNA